MSEDKSTKKCWSEYVSVISLAKPLIMKELSKIISRQPRRTTIIQARGGHCNNKKVFLEFLRISGQGEGSHLENLNKTILNGS